MSSHVLVFTEIYRTLLHRGKKTVPSQEGAASSSSERQHRSRLQLNVSRRWLLHLERTFSIAWAVFKSTLWHVILQLLIYLACASFGKQGSTADREDTFISARYLRPGLDFSDEWWPVPTILCCHETVYQVISVPLMSSPLRALERCRFFAWLAVRNRC